MEREVAALVDFVHAVALVVWIAGVPLLFWHRWAWLSRWYMRYAIAFIFVSQGSHYLLGHCVLTRVAAWFWQAPAGPGTDPDRWFTVRFAQAVFQMTPSHRSIVYAWEAITLVCCVGFLVTMHHGRQRLRKS